MYGIFVRCPDGQIEMPRVADSRQGAMRLKREIGDDPNWYGRENVWVEEIEEEAAAQTG